MAVQSNGHSNSKSNGTNGASVRFAPPKYSPRMMNGYDAITDMDTEVEVDEYDQPDASPYETRRIILLLGPHERKHAVPEYYLRQSPIFTDILSTCPHFITRTVPCIPLPDVDDDLIHTLVHYLHTGTYQTLRPDPNGDWTKTEYRRSVLCYGLATRYELLPLQKLARTYMQKLDTHLSIFDVLGVAKKVFGKMVPDYDPWFFDTYVRGKMADAFVEDRDLFERPRFQYLLGVETGFDKFLVRALVSIYEARIAELEERALRKGMQRDGGGYDEAVGDIGSKGLEDIAEEYPDEHELSVNGHEEYQSQKIGLDEIEDRPPSSAHASEGYPESVVEEEPTEEFPGIPAATAAAAAAGEYEGEELPAERYAPVDEPIAEEEPIPDDDHQAEPAEIPADESWNGWGSWAARTREWGYTTTPHEEPAGVPDEHLGPEPVPEPAPEEPLPDYPEVQPVGSEDPAPQESPVEGGRKKKKNDRKKRSTMSRTRALFSSAEEQPREQAVF
ncbi:uncharacterized protein BO97DRAFT_444745 [Aspergillus homomorphus CBS 101889]|uniref:BTB domain-containing protein n=1 Tax=Aspergillus homomorphus (strain CBS 101889) TaxID=1450537 RepID=A0A395HS46_ASPHC|nr:hypothetical protein BO97DRAFT_444745 [Aspergillus homomorphus CBS 101889]RAL10309.1 hypothetical protein BO97DRAFT_444745 [Aspergillus homomorphus CBS 101889]